MSASARHICRRILSLPLLPLRKTDSFSLSLCWINGSLLFHLFDLLLTHLSFRAARIPAYVIWNRCHWRPIVSTAIVHRSSISSFVSRRPLISHLKFLTTRSLGDRLDMKRAA